MSYTLPSTATQQSSLLLCVLNSSQEQGPLLEPALALDFAFILSNKTTNYYNKWVVAQQVQANDEK